MTSSLLTLHVVLEYRRSGGGWESGGRLCTGCSWSSTEFSVADAVVNEITTGSRSTIPGVISAVEHAVRSSLTRLGRAITFQCLISAGRIAVALARQRGSCGGSRCRDFDVSGDSLRTLFYVPTT